jgi:multidrug resistance efflux pump
MPCSSWTQLPWSRGWKVTVYATALGIALVVGALQYYTTASTKAVLEARTQQIFPLVTGGNIARITPDQKQAAYDEARAQLESAQYDLENTVVLAPAEGYVAINTLRPGQRVSSKTAALTFINVSELAIVAVMKQDGLSGIGPGKRATVSFSAAPGEIFQAEVIGIVLGVIQGQITIESASSALQAIQGAQAIHPIRIAWPEDAPAELRQPGKLAQVTVFTDEGNPINILAQVLQWLSTRLAFVL